MLESEILNHSTRKRIYQHIVDNPGVTFKILKRTFGVNEGTLNYHLDSLRKGDLIEIKKRKNERIYLPTEMSDPDTCALQIEQKRVLRCIRELPGSGVPEIVKRSGMSKKDVTRVIACLRRKRLIKGNKQGTSYGYHPISDQDLRNEVLLVLIDKYSRGEIPLNRLLQLKRKILDEVD
jgi:predicted transcriptional regulator